MNLLEDEPEQVWIEEIIETVFHEMQHHLESMAGRDDLARQELEELGRILGQRRDEQNALLCSME